MKEALEILEKLCKEYGRDMPSSKTIIELRDEANQFEGWALEDDCGEILCWDRNDFFTPAEPLKIWDQLTLAKHYVLCTEKNQASYYVNSDGELFMNLADVEIYKDKVIAERVAERIGDWVRVSEIEPDSEDFIDRTYVAGVYSIKNPLIFQ